MFNAWECPHCHNIYSPGTPFCVFCWFKNNLNSINNNDNKQSINIVEPLDIHTNTQEILKNDIQEQVQLNTIEQKTKEKQDINKNKYPDTKIHLMGIAHSKERAITRNIIIPYISDILQDFPINITSLAKKYLTYIKENNIEYLLDNNLSTLIKDKRKVDIKELLRQYTFYINEFDIKYFFDFDCEKLLSNTELESLRNDLFQETHKKPIPIWNSNLTDEDWTNMCKENDYICIGRFTDIENFNNSEMIKFIEQCDEAHSYGTQVHALDFSILNPLNQHILPFDSISSSNWSKEMKKYKTILVNNLLEKVLISEDESFVDTQISNLKAWVEFINNYKGVER